MRSDVTERLQALESRVSRLEAGQQEHAVELDEVRLRLGALQSSVDRVLSTATQHSISLDRQALVLQRVESLLEQLVRQQAPSVVVAGGRHG